MEPAVDRCAKCGHSRKEHSYNGACYGICAEFVPPHMNEWERGIREKVYAANILTPGEWVYLVGALNAAHDDERPEAD